MRFQVAICALLLGCNSTPTDLREWRPSDHDHTTNPGAAQVQVQPDAGSTTPAHGVDEVTIVAWSQNCARCHGTVGAGDGPQGPMLRTRDLTDGAWQAATSDEAIAAVIRAGKGAMPGFQLPETTVASLVRLVRLFDARRAQAAEAEPGSSNAHGSPAPTSGSPGPAPRGPTSPRL